MSTRILIICVFLISCSGSRMIETDLYFGQSKPDGSMVTEAEWNRFKEEHIARIFKEGSTTISAVGNWRDPVSNKLISEPTYMVIYFHKRSGDISKQIDSLRVIYQTVFQQQSVLRVDKKVTASF